MHPQPGERAFCHVRPARCPCLSTDLGRGRTVGASGLEDRPSYFSNWGDCVDVYAPGPSCPCPTSLASLTCPSPSAGESIISTWITGDSSAAVLQGTSMATPAVAGLVAYYLSTKGNMSTSEMHDLIVSTANQNMQGLAPGSPDRLA